jgi:hypothetical protein
MSGVDRFNQRADLALAKQGVLTDKELLSIDDLRDAWNAQSDAFNSWDELGIDEIIWFAQQQAAEAAKKVSQDIGMIDLPPDYIDLEISGRDREMLEAFYKACRSEGGTADEITLRGLKAALTRHARPAIRPVTVAERPWEREGWCDADGECWWCPRDGPPYWQMANPAMVYGGWLLPHHALPIPQPAPGP